MIFFILTLITSQLYAQSELICPIDRVDIKKTVTCVERRLLTNDNLSEDEYLHYARVLKLAGQINKVPLILKKFKTVNSIYVEIKLTNLWDKKKPSLVIKGYQHYKKKKIDVDQIKSIQKYYILSLKSEGKITEAKNHLELALKNFPDSPELKKITLEDNYREISMSQFNYAENDKRSISLTTLSYTYKEDSFILKPGYEFYQRDYLVDKLTDANFKLIGEHQGDRSIFTWNIEHSLSNVFIARNTFALGYHKSFKKHLLGIENIFKDFRHYNTYLIRLSDQYRHEEWLADLTVQVPSNQIQSQLIELEIKYQHPMVTPGLYYHFGQSNPATPFLTRDLESNFNLIGMKVEKIFFKRITTSIHFERRSEPSYEYEMLGGQLGVRF